MAGSRSLNNLVLGCLRQSSTMQSSVCMLQVAQGCTILTSMQPPDSRLPRSFCPPKITLCDRILLRTQLLYSRLQSSVYIPVLRSCASILAPTAWTNSNVDRHTPRRDAVSNCPKQPDASGQQRARGCRGTPERVHSGGADPHSRWIAITTQLGAKRSSYQKRERAHCVGDARTVDVAHV